MVQYNSHTLSLEGTLLSLMNKEGGTVFIDIIINIPCKTHS